MLQAVAGDHPPHLKEWGPELLKGLKVGVRVTDAVKVHEA